MRLVRWDMNIFKWEYKAIAGRPHRKRFNNVQAMFLGEWCDIQREMWNFKR